MNKLELVHKLVDNTYDPVSKAGTYSLKGSVHGDRLILKFKTIVNFASEQSLRPQVQSAKEHAHQLINDFVKKLKKDFKDSSGESLKLEDLGGDDNVEIIQSTSNSLRKIGYYRYNQNLVIS